MNMTHSKTRVVFAAVLFFLIGCGYVCGQGGYNDDRVMIQGFMWESSQQGKQKGNGGYEYDVDWKNKWYKHVEEEVNELAAAKFNLIWLPPPSHGDGAGYSPTELYDFNNNYGTAEEQKELLQMFLRAGIEPVADVVINHRNGSGGWATFKNPDWPSNFICSTDKFWFQNPDSLNQDDRKILLKGDKGTPDYSGSDYPSVNFARDLDHTNPALRAEIKIYLNKLQSLGYRGWRYDMVKGFAPQYVAEYDYASNPSFAVGEYYDGDAYKISGWIDGTKWQGQPDPAMKSCCAFDFATYYLLKQFINNGQYSYLPAVSYQDGVYDGLIAVNKNKAVTFLENHDTGFPQQQFDSFGNNEKLMQGYAFILTHPGIPCVYWKHYFDWNRGKEIQALIRARKYADVNSGSYIETDVNNGDYVAKIGAGRDSISLIVKIGPAMVYHPADANMKLETYGIGYAVWVLESKKMEMKNKVDAPLQAIAIP
jgi:alpha-amylase